MDILAKSADLEIAQITAVNHVNLIRSKLECEAIQDMTIRLQTLNPALTWATVTVPRLRELLIEQYDKKQPKVAALLHLFGNTRYKMTSEDITSHRTRFL